MKSTRCRFRCYRCCPGSIRKSLQLAAPGAGPWPCPSPLMPDPSPPEPLYAGFCHYHPTMNVLESSNQGVRNSCIPSADGEASGTGVHPLGPRPGVAIAGSIEVAIRLNLPWSLRTPEYSAFSSKKRLDEYPRSPEGVEDCYSLSCCSDDTAAFSENKLRWIDRETCQFVKNFSFPPLTSRKILFVGYPDVSDEAPFGFIQRGPKRKQVYLWQCVCRWLSSVF